VGKRTTSIGWSDPRTELGALLWPARMGAEELSKQKTALGSYGYAGQYQQRPYPLEGGLVKRHWWGFWKRPGTEVEPVTFTLADGTRADSRCIDLPTSFDRILQSWDMAFKDKKGGSFVVGQVIGSKGADRFLMDQDRRQMDFSVTLEAVRLLTKKWPQAQEKLVEDKANGPAVISALRHEISGIIEVEPQGGKEARAQAVLPAIESGNVYLPHPSIAPWVKDYIEEWAAAPNGDYWDQIDATSQALIRLQQRKVFFFT